VLNDSVAALVDTRIVTRYWAINTSLNGDATRANTSVQWRLQGRRMQQLRNDKACGTLIGGMPLTFIANVTVTRLKD